MLSSTELSDTATPEGQTTNAYERYRRLMEGVQEFTMMALWIAIAASPIAFIGLTFLHAARYPQWVWAFSERTQIVWLAGLLMGAAIVPLGLPLAIWYLVRVRPVLQRIEQGNLSQLSEQPGD